MAWIESHDTLGEHPKTRRLARVLGISVVQTVGHLQFFWWWAMRYADDGDVTRFDAIDIAEGAKWEGGHAEFLDALITAEFVDQSDEQTVIHDWDEYGGKLVRRKQHNAEQMRKSRQSPRVQHVLNTCETCVGPEESTGEKSTEEDKELSSESRAREEASPPAKQKRAERLPDEFELTDKRFEYAASKGMDGARINVTFEKFTTYWQRTGKAMKDWDAGWRNWVLNELERSPANGRASPGAAADDFLAYAAALREQGE